MNRIIKLGVILFVVHGVTNKVLGQEKRVKIKMDLIDNIVVKEFIPEVKDSSNNVEELTAPIRAIRYVSICYYFNKFKSDKYFFQYEGQNQLREEYYFPGYNRNKIDQ